MVRMLPETYQFPLFIKEGVRGSSYYPLFRRRPESIMGETSWQLRRGVWPYAPTSCDMQTLSAPVFKKACSWYYYTSAEG